MWSAAYRSISPARRPRLAADLVAGRFVLEHFLPAAIGTEDAVPDQASSLPTAAAGLIWSTEPFDLGPLRELDAELTLAAEALSVAGYRFDDAELELALENGTLDIGRLDGRLFEGDASVTAQLVGERSAARADHG